MPFSSLSKIAEEKIREAQKNGAFDNLPGKGKPLELEDLSSVPEELRVAYNILKNAHVLPPEVALKKEIYTLEDLLRHVEGDEERKRLSRSIQAKIIRLDLLQRRSFSPCSVGFYGRKLAWKFVRLGSG
jgi:hypothetical protein